METRVTRTRMTMKVHSAFWISYDVSVVFCLEQRRELTLPSWRQNRATDKRAACCTDA